MYYLVCFVNFFDRFWFFSFSYILGCDVGVRCFKI